MKIEPGSVAWLVFYVSYEAEGVAYGVACGP